MVQSPVLDLGLHGQQISNEEVMPNATFEYKTVTASDIAEKSTEVKLTVSHLFQESRSDMAVLSKPQCKTYLYAYPVYCSV